MKWIFFKENLQQSQRSISINIIMDNLLTEIIASPQNRNQLKILKTSLFMFTTYWCDVWKMIKSFNALLRITHCYLLLPAN